MSVTSYSVRRLIRSTKGALSHSKPTSQRTSRRKSSQRMAICQAIKFPRFLLARKGRHSHRRRHCQRGRSALPSGSPSYNHEVVPHQVLQPLSSPGYTPPRSATQRDLAMGAGESFDLGETDWCVSSGWSTSEASLSNFDENSRHCGTSQWSDQSMTSYPFFELSRPSPGSNASEYDSNEPTPHSRSMYGASEYPVPQPLTLPGNHTLSVEFQKQMREAMDELNRQVTYHDDLLVERMRQVETTMPAVDVENASPCLTGAISNGEDDEGTLVDGDDDPLNLLTQSLERDFTVKDYSLVTDYAFVL
ncbi:hypothetical protein IWQ62_003340 [Dispira parvispora]|uniref:Uncharacterized protein n=1 Tax=Dispira parvispora TaxID=1520584 RepID=A0A9W8E302_9FUNG|nr:hypothetical protein IWQ62_003340 [Dispira parvispora]